MYYSTLSYFPAKNRGDAIPKWYENICIKSLQKITVYLIFEPSAMEKVNLGFQRENLI
jgi:hypothetical protein